MAVTPSVTHVDCLIGTNDFDNGTSAAAVWANVRDSVLVPLLARGIKVTVYCDLPRTITGGWSAENQRQSLQYNQILRENAPAYGADVFDPTGRLIDSAGALLTNYFYDGIHPATLGAERIGYARAVLLANQLSNIDNPGCVHALDLFDATNNPRGNVLTNGVFAGTGGGNTSSGGVASGTVASGWTNRTLTGTGTSTASLVARTDGKPGNWQQLVLDSAGGLSTYRFYQTTNPAINTNYVAGAKYVMELDVEWDGATGLEVFSPFVQDYDGSTVYETVNCMNSTLINVTYYPHAATFAGRLRSKPLTLNALSTQFLVRIEAQVNTGAATVRFGAAEVRQAAI